MGLLRAISTAIFTAFACLITIAPALAKEGKQVAFVVGIKDYPSLGPGKEVTNAVNDAKGVGQRLRDLNYTLVDAKPNLKRSDFNRIWQEVLNTLAKEDTFIFYFSGHGVQVDGNNYLLPSDIPFIQYGRAAQLTREAISVNEIVSDLTTGDREHPRYAILILDACRDDPFLPPGFKKSGSTAGGLAKINVPEIVHREEPEPGGVFVLYAAAAYSTALERLSQSDPDPYSLFTRVLVKLLDRSDLSIQEMTSKVREQVRGLASSVGQKQFPAYEDGIFGRFCIPGCTESPARPVEVVGKSILLGEPLIHIDNPERPGHLTGESNNRAIHDYFKVVQKRISEYWTPPFGNSHSTSASVDVIFRLLRDGAATNIEFESLSGNDYYDRAAIRAVRNASPFPPFPQQILAGHMNTRVRFIFDGESE